MPNMSHLYLKLLTVFNKMSSNILSNIETKETVETFEYLKELVVTIRRLSAEQNLNLKSGYCYIDLVIPYKFFVPTISKEDVKYVDILKKHLQHMFKDVTFTLYSNHEKYLLSEYQTSFTLPNKGQLVVYSHLLTPKTVNKDKLQKELNKLTALLSNTNFLKAQTTVNLNKMRDKLHALELQLKGH